MLDSTITDERLASLEWAIECLRPYRNEPGTPEHRHLAAFKRMAAEIRGTEPARVSAVLQAMEAAVDSARRSKGRIGYVELGHMQHITEGLLGRWWPTVRKALQNYREEGDAKARVG